MKDYICYYRVRNYYINVYINFNKFNENLQIYCLKVTRNLNPKNSFPICMFVVMASENVSLIYI